MTHKTVSINRLRIAVTFLQATIHPKYSTAICFEVSLFDISVELSPFVVKSMFWLSSEPIRLQEITYPDLVVDPACFLKSTLSLNSNSKNEAFSLNRSRENEDQIYFQRTYQQFYALVISIHLDCLQSAFSLKIRPVLDLIQHDQLRLKTTIRCYYIGIETPSFLTASGFAARLLRFCVY